MHPPRTQPLAAKPLEVQYRGLPVAPFDEVIPGFLCYSEPLPLPVLSPAKRTLMLHVFAQVPFRPERPCSLHGCQVPVSEPGSDLFQHLGHEPFAFIRTYHIAKASCFGAHLGSEIRSEGGAPGGPPTST